MSRLQLAIEQIVFARNYTIGLLDQTPTDEWFRLPQGGVNHVAGQVGHIVFAEYRLVATTKLRALLWCAHHEMLHAGQIGLLRRHLGYSPMWRGKGEGSKLEKET